MICHTVCRIIIFQDVVSQEQADYLGAAIMAVPSLSPKKCLSPAHKQMTRAQLNNLIDFDNVDWVRVDDRFFSCCPNSTLDPSMHKA